MIDPTAVNREFRERVCAREPLVGVFVKTSTPQVVEILATTGLDWIVLDCEHAPFDRLTLDMMLLAARAHGLAAIVRLEEVSERAVLSALDMGAAGVMAPHVRTAEEASTLVGYAKYARGRGFSNSHRAGGYGRMGVAELVCGGDLGSTVIAMIEDPEGAANAEAIARVDGIDCLYVGRADMTVALGETRLDAPRVDIEVRKIEAALAKTGKAGGEMRSTTELAAARQKGFSAFLIGTDQGLLRTTVGSAVTTARGYLQ
jgi:2-keto-3-deoxy-L-rhamnonate aldolase RhmA